MSKKELIRRLQISCLGLDPIDPLRLLVNDVIEALEQPQRTWVGLTDEEVESLQRLAIDPVDANGWGFLNRERFACLIEIKLKEKNT